MNKTLTKTHSGTPWRDVKLRCVTLCAMTVNSKRPFQLCEGSAVHRMGTPEAQHHSCRSTVVLDNHSKQGHYCTQSAEPTHQTVLTRGQVQQDVGAGQTPVCCVANNGEKSKNEHQCGKAHQDDTVKNFQGVLYFSSRHMGKRHICINMALNIATRPLATLCRWTWTAPQSWQTH